ncbi:hypothetical protein VP01_366g7 [Puccinia sorghi]|uniref:Uncharacterized protein n=1 Tax=Puccinia sorghi TaxID=27349 RepID=A0A0L6UV68_9BASI|nr:hypothetical protein VP01_366g7 [Puccinia sorghi]
MCEGGIESPEPEPTAGASNSSAIVDNIRSLQEEQMACEQLTGSSEFPVFINPSKSNKFILLTVDWVSVWDPPKLPPFNFMTREDYLMQFHGTSKAPPGGGMTFHPYTMPPFGYMPSIPCPPMCFAYPQIPNYGQPPYMQNPAIPNRTLSPVPSDNHIDLEEYFLFSHMDMNEGGVVVALGKLGITHYLQFQNFQATKLEEARMKRAHARALISSYQRFEQHLKSSCPHWQ